MRSILSLIAVCWLCHDVSAHGGTFVPPPNHKWSPPSGGVPPPMPQPQPGDGPTTPPDNNPGPPEIRPEVRPTVRSRPASGGEDAWRIWWELNREHLVSLRKLMRQPATITGRPTERRDDPLGEHRGQVLAALRRTARNASDRTLRAAAILALGRMGHEGDARYFLELLADRDQPSDVQEAAAVALGIVKLGDADARAATRAYLTSAIRGRVELPTRAKGLAVLGAGLRARDDPTLVMTLAGRLDSVHKLHGRDAAELMYACGLAGDPMPLPELLPAVKRGRISGRRLSDAERSHATLALGMCGDQTVVRHLAAAIGSRSARIHTKRSAALALGRLLRESRLGKDATKIAVGALLKTLDKGRDPVLRGFAAASLGGARPPAGIRQLEEAIDHGGNMEIKPFCALGLGLAARTLGDRDGKKIRNFLLDELEKTNHFGLGAALSIASGLANADKATRELMMRLTKKGLDARVRGAAAQGLGLMGSRNPDVHKVLEELAVREYAPDLLQDVVLALGMIGRRGVAHDLIKLLSKTKSSRLQERIILALAHLDHSAAVEPLLTILDNEKERPIVREFAAAALGIMGDRRAKDPLFACDAYFNFYAGTPATHELVRLY